MNNDESRLELEREERRLQEFCGGDLGWAYTLHEAEIHDLQVERLKTWEMIMAEVGVDRMLVLADDYELDPPDDLVLPTPLKLVRGMKEST
jgi:hypothetical protein